MNFKNLGEKNRIDRYDIEETINRGIEIFNSTNNEDEDIPLINKYEYGIRNETFDFEDDYILIKWERDEGRCGDEYLVDHEQKIPYEYFESTQEDIDIQDKIKEDKQNREKNKKFIKDKENEIENFRKELREHEGNLRDLEKIKKKYIGNSYYDKKIEKAIEREIIKSKGAIYLKEDELKKIKEEI